jgi:hypothetical protein
MRPTGVGPSRILLPPLALLVPLTAGGAAGAAGARALSSGDEPLLLVVFGVLVAVVGALWLMYAWTFRQALRLEALRTELQDAIVFAAISDGWFGIAIQDAHPHRSITQYCVVSFDDEGLRVWAGARQPRQTLHLPWEVIESVSVGSTQTQATALAPTIDAAVPVGDRIEVVAFAPTFQGWRLLWAHRTPEFALGIADAIRARWPEKVSSVA